MRGDFWLSAAHLQPLQDARSLQPTSGQPALFSASGEKKTFSVISKTYYHFLHLFLAHFDTLSAMFCDKTREHSQAWGFPIRTVMNSRCAPPETEMVAPTLKRSVLLPVTQKELNDLAQRSYTRQSGGRKALSLRGGILTQLSKARKT